MLCDCVGLILTFMPVAALGVRTLHSWPVQRGGGERLLQAVHPRDVFRVVFGCGVPGMRCRSVLVGAGQRVFRLRTRDIFDGRGFQPLSAVHCRHVFRGEFYRVSELPTGHVFPCGWRGDVRGLRGESVFEGGVQPMLSVSAWVHI
jgi:hypothetical protein